MRLTAFVLLALAGFCPAHAQEIDLSQPWGNASGCVNKDGQEVYAEDMLLLTEEALVLATGACTFTSIETGEDGVLTADALCEAEGEQAENRFTIAPNPANEAELIVSDFGGYEYGRVSRCE